VSKVVDKGFPERMGRIEALIGTIEQSADPATRAAAQELVQSVLELHAEGLSRILARLEEDEDSCRSIVESLAADDLVGNLLLLHGLHPLDLETRVRQALDSVRPLLRSHHGEVTLVSVTDGEVRLRLEGNCHGCPSSASTMRHSIEQAVTSAAPDVTAIHVEGLVEEPKTPGGLITIDQLLVSNSHPRSEPSDRVMVGPHS
jgi:Fe-S cluster biogenesis protein NfuA